jgi:broad specificity phosphatase PhoE
VVTVYLVRHGEKEPEPGDPGLTPAGGRQALATGRWLREVRPRALYASPLRRARETAEHIAEMIGRPVQVDVRLRERLNWGGDISRAQFVADWAHTTRDRDFVPSTGASSRQAGDRLQAFITGLLDKPGPVAVVTHGGVTVDLIRNLIPEDELPPGLLEAGIPPCAITTLSCLHVASIAASGHLTCQSRLSASGGSFHYEGKPIGQ